MPRVKKMMLLDQMMASSRAQNRLLTQLKPDTAARATAKKKASELIEGHSELEVMALTSIKAFADLIKFKGGWNKFGQCHDELVEFLCFPQTNEEAQAKLKHLGDEGEAGLRRLVLMPRGHLKSTIGTVLYSLWRIYRNPEMRILVACNLQSLATSFIRELRSYLENKDLEAVWNNRPHISGPLLPALDKRLRARNTNEDTEAEDKKVIWNNTAIQVNRQGSYKEPTVFATSVGTTVTGMHFDLVILDDLIDFKNVESPAKKQMVEEWIADVESVLNPPNVVTIAGLFEDTVGGEIVVNGTRYAVDDYYGQILERADELGYKCFVRNIYKNGVDASEGYLWHEKYNDYVVENLKARLSPRRFASQYLNKVYEKEYAVFDVSAIRVVADSCFGLNSGHSYFSVPGSSKLDRVFPIIAVDPSFAGTKTADECAILGGFKLSDGTLVVQEAIVDQMSGSRMVEALKDMAYRLNTVRVFYEENGVGLLVPELLKHEAAFVNGRPLVANGHFETRSKESKIVGVLELPIAAGKLWVSEKVRNNEKIWKQLTDYPAVRNDDFLDALVILYENSRPTREIVQQTLPLMTSKLSVFNKPEPASYLAAFNSFFS
jgi:hypothetical protein